MLELYHSGTSVCVAKVRIALAEKALEWTGHYLDILAGEQFDPAYLKLNPKGVVPTLVHDGEVFTESTVICEYLDEAFPATPLRPDSPAARARMRMWTKMVDEVLHPACADLTFVVSHARSVIAKGEDNIRRFIDDAPDHISRERRHGWIHLGAEAPSAKAAIKAYVKALDQMEAALGDGTWLAGDDYSLADIGVVPYVNRLDMLNMASLWDTRPNVADWFRRMRARPSFETGIFAHMPAGPRDEMLAHGREGGPAFLAATGYA